ncbi:hypothetical protein GCM10025734_02580 [Kitasatospora paranensis]
MNVHVDWSGVREHVIAVDEAERRARGTEPSSYPLFEPVLTLAEIAEAEAQFGVTLPEEYRTFLAEVGAGGPGPGRLSPLCRINGVWGWQWDTAGHQWRPKIDLESRPRPVLPYRRPRAPPRERHHRRPALTVIKPSVQGRRARLTIATGRRDISAVRGSGARVVAPSGLKAGIPREDHGWFGRAGRCRASGTQVTARG